MTQSKEQKADIVTTAAVPDDLSAISLQGVGGSSFDPWNATIVEQATDALWLANSNPHERERQTHAAIAGLFGIDPKDELEGMMAAQLIAAHNAAMECYRRAMIGKQTFEARRENLNHANKLSRTWTMLLDALNKHRGKGQQKVTVEYVNVHAGGQAVVGTVERSRGGGCAKSED